MKKNLENGYGKDFEGYTSSDWINVNNFLKRAVDAVRNSKVADIAFV